MTAVVPLADVNVVPFETGHDSVPLDVGDRVAAADADEELELELEEETSFAPYTVETAVAVCARLFM